MNYLTNINLNRNELQNAVIQPLSTAPSNPKEGQIYYNSSDKFIYRYDGTAWKPVGVVYSQGSTTGAVITGLDSTGNVTTTNVTGLTLTGYTPVSGGYVSNNMSLSDAFKALDTAVQNAVAGGGEVNQNAWSNISVKKQSTATTAVSGQSADTTVAATAKTDTFVLATGNKWVDVNANGKQINIGHSLSGATAGNYGDSTHATKVTVDAAGHVTSAESVAIAFPDAPEYSITKDATAQTGYIATYHLTKDGTNVGTAINIPKDYLVKSAEIKTSTGSTDPSGLPSGTKYIDFVVNTYTGSGTESHIYLSVEDLVDVYTAGNGIDISSSNAVSAKVVAANGLSVDSNGIKMALASSTANGAMSSGAYTKLDGVDTGATKNTITLNGVANANPSFYAPTSAGSNGQVLLSSGSGAPTWGTLPEAFHKYVGTNSALSASGGVFSWSISASTHGISNAGIIVQVYEVSTGEMVITDVVVNQTNYNVTIKINGTGSLAANTYKAVIFG